MKVPCQRILFWLRVVSFSTLVHIANAPELKHLSVPPVCIGEDLQLRWEYDFSSATVGKIVWKFTQSEQDNAPITIAVMNMTNWTFQIDPGVASRYANRLTNMKGITNAAGIQLLYVSEVDEGSYEIQITIDKPNYFMERDTVNVTLVNVTSYVLNHSDSGSNEVCCNVSRRAILPWNVTNPGLPADEKVCKKPTWAELRKNGKVIVEKQRIDAKWIDVVEHDVDLNSRVSFRHESPFDILIEETKLTDSGNYTIAVRYGNISITSDEIKLQVSMPMKISRVADIRQCAGTSVTFPWELNLGLDCKNRTRDLDGVYWTRVSESKEFCSLRNDAKPPFVCTDPRVSRYRSNAGISIHYVKKSDTGTYEVMLALMNGQNLKARTNLTVERPQTPTIARGFPSYVEMCEGESFAFNWTLEYPERGICPYAKVISRSWYLNQNSNPILTDDDDDRTTSEKPPDPDETGSGEGTTVDKTTPMTTTTTSSTTLPKDVSKASVTGTSKGSSARRGRRFVSDQTDSSPFSAYHGFDAGLAVRNVISNNSGVYHVKVSFNATDEIVDVWSVDNFEVVVKNAPVVSLHDEDGERQLQELCTDGVLRLRWDVDKGDCNRPFKISWHLRFDNGKEVKIGQKENGDGKPTKNFRGRAKFIGGANLDIQNLTAGESGIYIARLTYITDQSVNVSERSDLKGSFFSESTVNAIIYNLSSDDCTGKKLSSLKVRITRNGEDVQKSTDQTVRLNDMITLAVDLPNDTGMRIEQAQFFWKETQHKVLKQFFGKKCREPGLCSIQFKILKSLPGIRFQLNEHRREVLFGMKILHLQTKMVTIQTPFYYRNHKEEAADAEGSKPAGTGKKGGRRRSGAVKQCALSGQVALTAAMFWILVMHEQRP